jgi:hypothetical protein
METQITELPRSAKVKDLPADYIGYWIGDGIKKNAYTVEEALVRFEKQYGYKPERAVKWQEYLLVVRTDKDPVRTGLFVGYNK